MPVTVLAQEIAALICDCKESYMNGPWNGEERRVRIKKSERRWQEEGIELRRKRCKDGKKQKLDGRKLYARVDSFVISHFGSKTLFARDSL